MKKIFNVHIVKINYNVFRLTDKILNKPFSKIPISRSLFRQ